MPGRGDCKTRKTISTIAILWRVKAIFEKRAATVEVDNLISPKNSSLISKEKVNKVTQKKSSLRPT